VIALHDVERFAHRTILKRIVTGSTIMPDSERFTLSTSSAWRSSSDSCAQRRCRLAADGDASDASVTVSIAAEQSGICKRIRA